MHKLTAVSFAVIYGVVGFTGESLHYLLTDPASIWSGAGGVEPAGYYHVHAPDYHGHFHRHDHKGSHSHVDGVAANDSGQPTDELAFKSEAFTHEHHPCPLLALVSTLKLGHGASCVASIILDALVAPYDEFGGVCAIHVAPCCCARGPPGHSLA
jgi:hypothetical protein